MPGINFRLLIAFSGLRPSAKRVKPNGALVVGYCGQQICTFIVCACMWLCIAGVVSLSGSHLIPIPSIIISRSLALCKYYIKCAPECLPCLLASVQRASHTASRTGTHPSSNACVRACARTLIAYNRSSSRIGSSSNTTTTLGHPAAASPFFFPQTDWRDAFVASMHASQLSPLHTNARSRAYM